jgi:Arc/MetJ-type ribon-helix-helix transcriptional regulator
MREASKQISIRLPPTADVMLEDLLQEGVFRNRTEAIVEGIQRLYEDFASSESEVNLRLRLTRGDYNNLKRLSQLEGGTEELWAERLLSLYSLHHARLLAQQVEEWDSIFREKRKLEERTESLTEIRQR